MEQNETQQQKLYQTSLLACQCPPNTLLPDCEFKAYFDNMSQPTTIHQNKSLNSQYENTMLTLEYGQKVTPHPSETLESSCSPDSHARDSDIQVKNNNCYKSHPDGIADNQYPVDTPRTDQPGDGNHDAVIQFYQMPLMTDIGFPKMAHKHVQFVTTPTHTTQVPLKCYTSIVSYDQSQKEFDMSLHSGLSTNQSQKEFDMSLHSRPSTNQSQKEFDTSLQSEPSTNQSQKEFGTSLQFGPSTNQSQKEFDTSLQSYPSTNQSQKEFHMSLHSGPSTNQSQKEFDTSLHSEPSTNQSQKEFDMSLHSGPSTNQSQKEVDTSLHSGPSSTNPVHLKHSTVTDLPSQIQKQDEPKPAKPALCAGRVAVGTGVTNKTYKCGICGKSYKLYNSWRNHKISHTHKKALKESRDVEKLESMLLQQSMAAIAQMTTGTDEKHPQLKRTSREPYKCDHCDKTFMYSANRDNHSKKHGQVSKQKVETKSDRLHRKHTEAANIARHIKAQQDSILASNRSTYGVEYPFQCKICDKMFMDHFNCTMHVQSSHSSAELVQIRGECGI